VVGRDPPPFDAGETGEQTTGQLPDPVLQLGRGDLALRQMGSDPGYSDPHYPPTDIRPLSMTAQCPI
jgi:hypothetical protein